MITANCIHSGNISEGFREFIALKISLPPKNMLFSRIRLTLRINDASRTYKVAWSKIRASDENQVRSGEFTRPLVSEKGGKLCHNRQGGEEGGVVMKWDRGVRVGENGQRMVRSKIDR